MDEQTTVRVPLSDLFDSEYPQTEVGEPKDGAEELLQAHRAAGSRIVITGPILLTVFGTRAVMRRLYDLGMEFDELEQV